MFFYVGKVFCLRGGQEQRDLKLSQVVRSSNPDRYTYVENGLFMRAQILVQDVWFFSLIYTFPSFQIMDNAKDMDCFYLRPRKKFTCDTPWYDCAPVGKGTMKKFKATMCAAAGIERKTNHSLRATGRLLCSMLVFQKN